MPHSVAEDDHFVAVIDQPILKNIHMNVMDTFSVFPIHMQEYMETTVLWFCELQKA
jgi:hypothetical protein